ncbi:MAG: hypothetical protein EA001_06970 [Oscillatoriales cyanobacterium]|nr:MAG: hypothetical protein EA001_06970 [Oscillatoriales cyanobacterium]
MFQGRGLASAEGGQFRSHPERMSEQYLAAQTEYQWSWGSRGPKLLVSVDPWGIQGVKFAGYQICKVSSLVAQTSSEI